MKQDRAPVEVERPIGYSRHYAGSANRGRGAILSCLREGARVVGHRQTQTNSCRAEERARRPDGSAACPKLGYSSVRMWIGGGAAVGSTSWLVDLV